MRAETIEIRDLLLRIPGIDRRAARDLGEEVARRLAEELPSWPLRHAPGAIDLRVRVPAGARHRDLPRIIAREIARALR